MSRPVRMFGRSLLWLAFAFLVGIVTWGLTAAAEVLVESAPDVGTLGFDPSLLASAADTGQWLAVGVFAVAGLAWLLNRGARKVPGVAGRTLRTRQGKFWVASIAGVAGLVGAALVAGRPMSMNLLVVAIVSTLAAKGGYDANRESRKAAKAKAVSVVAP